MRVDVGDHAWATTVHRAARTGRTAILLHGFAGSREDWRNVLDAFGPRTTVVTVDLIGHGESDAPEDPGPYAFDRVADALARLADGLGIESAVWVGYSFGARLLLPFALRHPERMDALVLESAHPGISSAAERRRRRDQDLDDAALLETAGLDAFLDRWHARPAFATRRQRAADWMAEVERRRRTNRAPALARCLRGLGLGAQPPLDARLDRIRLPVLLLAGERDEGYSHLARRMASRLPEAQLVVAPGAGHCVHAEAPRAYAAAALRFVAEREEHGRSAPARGAATARQARAGPGPSP